MMAVQAKPNRSKQIKAASSPILNPDVHRSLFVHALNVAWNGLNHHTVSEFYPAEITYHHQ